MPYKPKLQVTSRSRYPFDPQESRTDGTPRVLSTKAAAQRNGRVILDSFSMLKTLLFHLY